MQQSKRKQKSFTHWNQRLNLEYHFFLILNYQDFTCGSKKTNRLYKEMSNFLSIKTSTQCRTHHQKKIKGLKREVDILYSFYQDYYQIRNLEVDHMVLEIKKCLQKKINGNIISRQRAQLLEERLQDTLGDLKFTNVDLEQTPPVADRIETKDQEIQSYQESLGNDIDQFFSLDSERSSPAYSFDQQENEDIIEISMKSREN